MGKVENATKNAILSYLNMQQNCFAWSSNTGGMKTPSGGWINFGFPGSPDVLCCYHGLFVGVEVKTAKGRQNNNQEKFEVKIRGARGVYILARSVQDVINRLEEIK